MSHNQRSSFVFESLPEHTEAPFRLIKNLVRSVVARDCCSLILPGCDEAELPNLISYLYDNPNFSVSELALELDRVPPEVIYVPSTFEEYKSYLEKDRQRRERLKIRSAGDYKSQVNEVNVWFNSDKIVPVLPSSDQTSFITMAKYGSGIYVFDHTIDFDAVGPTMQRVLGNECRATYSIE